MSLEEAIETRWHAVDSDDKLVADVEIGTSISFILEGFGWLPAGSSILAIEGSKVFNSWNRVKKLEESIDLSQGEAMYAGLEHFFDGTIPNQLFYDEIASRVYHTYIEQYLSRIPETYEFIVLGLPNLLVKENQVLFSGRTADAEKQNVGGGFLSPQLLNYTLDFSLDTAVQVSASFQQSLYTRLLPKQLGHYTLSCAPLEDNIQRNEVRRYNTGAAIDRSWIEQLTNPHPVIAQDLKKLYFSSFESHCRNAVIYRHSSVRNGKHFYHLNNENNHIILREKAATNEIFFEGKHLSITQQLTSEEGSALNNISDIKQIKVDGDSTSNLILVVEREGSQVILPSTVHGLRYILKENNQLRIYNREGNEILVPIDTVIQSKEGWFITVMDDLAQDAPHEIRYLKLEKKLDKDPDDLMTEVDKLTQIDNAHFILTKRLISDHFNILVSYHATSQVFWPNYKSEDERQRTVFYIEAPASKKHVYRFSGCGALDQSDTTDRALRFCPHQRYILAKANGLIQLDLDTEASVKDLLNIKQLDNGQIEFNYKDLNLTLLSGYQDVDLTLDAQHYYRLQKNGRLVRNYCSHVLKITGHVQMNATEVANHYNCFDFNADKIRFLKKEGKEDLLLISNQASFQINQYYSEQAALFKFWELSVRLNHHLIQPAEFEKNTQSPTEFQYYPPSSLSLQIYHNQPINRHQIGVINLKDHALAECELQLVDNALALSKKNFTLVKLERFSDLPEAREILFSFQEALFDHWQCMLSSCSPIEVIEAFNLLKNNITMVRALSLEADRNNHLPHQKHEKLFAPIPKDQGAELSETTSGWFSQHFIGLMSAGFGIASAAVIYYALRRAQVPPVYASGITRGLTTIFLQDMEVNAQPIDSTESSCVEVDSHEFKKKTSQPVRYNRIKQTSQFPKHSLDTSFENKTFETALRYYEKYEIRDTKQSVRPLSKPEFCSNSRRLTDLDSQHKLVKQNALLQRSQRIYEANLNNSIKKHPENHHCKHAFKYRNNRVLDRRTHQKTPPLNLTQALKPNPYSKQSNLQTGYGLSCQSSLTDWNRRPTSYLNGGSKFIKAQHFQAPPLPTQSRALPPVKEFHQHNYSYSQPHSHTTLKTISASPDTFATLMACKLIFSYQKGYIVPKSEEKYPHSARLYKRMYPDNYTRSGKPKNGRLIQPGNISEIVKISGVFQRN